MLDIHPQPTNSQIEVWTGDEVHRLGEIDQREDHAEIEAARAHLHSFEVDGSFVKQAEGHFDLLEIHDSVESWQERWSYEGYRLLASEELLEAARVLLARPACELVIREPVRATTYSKLL